jgi:hypothetical protein
MMPELDQPFGRHRWDPLAEIETLMTTDVTAATSDEDMPAIPAQADVTD